jgi:hypothetical protein
MEPDNYSKGRHFWTHFWFGFIIGAGIGAWISWRMFQSRWACAGLATGIALVFACCAGRWGDTFWEWILKTWQ